MRKVQLNSIIAVSLLATAAVVLSSPVLHAGFTRPANGIAKSGIIDQPVAVLADAFEYVVLTGCLVLPGLLVVRRFEFRSKPVSIYTAHFQSVFVRPPPVR